MKAGDLVRLNQPFRPTDRCLQDYRFGIVAGVVGGNPQKKNPKSMEIVLYLYSPETNTLYTDETGAQAMFSFYLDEITGLS